MPEGITFEPLGEHDGAVVAVVHVHVHLAGQREVGGREKLAGAGMLPRHQGAADPPSTPLRMHGTVEVHLHLLGGVGMADRRPDRNRGAVGGEAQRRVGEMVDTGELERVGDILPWRHPGGVVHAVGRGDDGVDRVDVGRGRPAPYGHVGVRRMGQDLRSRHARAERRIRPGGCLGHPHTLVGAQDALTAPSGGSSAAGEAQKWRVKTCSRSRSTKPRLS